MARRKRRKSAGGGFQIRGVYLWIVGGVVVLGLLFVLTRNLATPTDDAPLFPVLANARTELGTLTRMLGEVRLSPEATATLSTVDGIADVDSLLRERNWPEAAERLRRISRSSAADRLPAVRYYLGYCYSQSASPDRALREFRSVTGNTAAAGSVLRCDAAFSAGYLFQSRGFADSALILYTAAHRLTPDTAQDERVAWLNNNRALALEMTGDTAAARACYLAAAVTIDTSADTRESRVLRDNLRQLALSRIAAPATE